MGMPLSLKLAATRRSNRWVTSLVSSSSRNQLTLRSSREPASSSESSSFSAAEFQGFQVLFDSFVVDGFTHAVRARLS